MNLRDRGSVSLELVIIASLMLAFICFIVGLGRVSLAKQDVTAAAYDAARTASLTRTGSPTAAGHHAAEQSLGDRGMSCASLTVSVNVSSYTPGGHVTTTVTCTARLSDLAVSGLPGSKTYTATAVVPIEQYRVR